MKKSRAGKQVRNTKCLQPLALLGTARVYLRPQFGLLLKKGCLGLNSAIRFWHMAPIEVNGSPVSAYEGTV